MRIYVRGGRLIVKSGRSVILNLGVFSLIAIIIAIILIWSTLVGKFPPWT